MRHKLSTQFLLKTWGDAKSAKKDIQRIGISFYENSTYPIEILLMPSKGLFHWGNGVIVRVNTSDEPAELAVRMRPALERFSEWAILRSDTQCAQSGSEGALTYVMRNLPSPKRHSAALLYLMPHDANNKVLDQISEEFKRSGHPIHSVFEFNAGKVYVCPSHEPDTFVRRRISPYLGRLTGYCYAIDCSQHFDCNGYIPNIWQVIRLDEFTFGQLIDAHA